MNLIQSLRRLGQKNSYWSNAMNAQDAQSSIIRKLYLKNGLDLRMTCGACPEQYDVFKDGERVAYYRLRHGCFTVEYPDCGGELIYEVEPNGDGIFDDNERVSYMIKALRKLLVRINNA